MNKRSGVLFLSSSIQDYRAFISHQNLRICENLILLFAFCWFKNNNNTGNKLKSRHFQFFLAQFVDSNYCNFFAGMASFQSQNQNSDFIQSCQHETLNLIILISNIQWTWKEYWVAYRYPYCVFFSIQG